MKSFNLNTLKYETKLVLISDENYPFELVEKILENENNTALILEAINRKDVSCEFLHEFVGFSDHNVRKAIALNSNTSVDDLNILSKDLIDDVVIATIQNSNISNKFLQEIIDKLDDYSINVIKALIENNNLTKSQLKMLYLKVLGKFFNDDLLKELFIGIINNDKVTPKILTEMYSMTEINYQLRDAIFKEICIKRNDCEKFFVEVLNSKDNIANFIQNYSCFIRYLPKNIFNIIFNYIKEDIFPYGGNEEEQIIINLSSYQNLSDEAFGWIIESIYYFKHKHNIKSVISNLLNNDTLSTNQVNYLWKISKVRNFLGTESIRKLFLVHPNIDVKILNYLKSVYN